MKTPISLLISFVVIAVVAYAVTFTGCSNSVTSTGTAPETHQARTEAEFTDTNFFADPQSVVLLHLEHLHSPVDSSQHDTDSLGVDVFRIRVPRTAEHTFRMGDSSNFKVTLIDKTTRTIVCQLDPVNNFKTVTIPAGDYIVVIRSLVEYTGGTNTHQNVFIQPDRDIALYRGGGNQQIYADSNSVHTLLTTNSCIYCDLSYANLSHAVLDSANLYYAVLSYANLSYAILNSANFVYGNLSYANLSSANLKQANLNNANLSYANLYSANLSGVNLQTASLIHADFSYTNLSNAFLTYSNLTSASFNQANLNHANLNHANLNYAFIGRSDLSYASLSYAVMTHADLSYSNFSYANLSYANLTGATLNNAIFCNAIKTGVINGFVIMNSGTQCWP